MRLFLRRTGMRSRGPHKYLSSFFVEDTKSLTRCSNCFQRCSPFIPSWNYKNSHCGHQKTSRNWLNRCSDTHDTVDFVFQVQLILRFQFQTRSSKITKNRDRNRGNQHNSNIAIESDDQGKTNTDRAKMGVFHKKIQCAQLKPSLSHEQRRNVNTADTRRKNAQLPLLPQKRHQTLKVVPRLLCYILETDNAT